MNSGESLKRSRGPLAWKRLIGCLVFLGLVLGAVLYLRNGLGDLAGPDLGIASALLPDGRVLLAGGYKDERLRLVDPASGQTQIVPMPEGRIRSGAVVLRDGRVLLFAGMGTRSARLFSCGTGAFSAAIPMIDERIDPLAVNMSDGRVLIIGGVNGGLPGQQSTEWFDPGSLKFSLGPSLKSVNKPAAAVTLPMDQVLVIGDSLVEASKHPNTYSPHDPVITGVDLYDPAIGAFTSLSPLRDFLAVDAIPLGNGRALLIGIEVKPSSDQDPPWNGAPSPDRDLFGRRLKAASWYFDLNTHVFTEGPSGFPLQSGKRMLLDDRHVLFLGDGYGSATIGNRGGILDLSDDTFKPLDSFPQRAHPDGAVVRLSDGRILIAGGKSGGAFKSPPPFIEILDPREGRYTPLILRRTRSNPISNLRRFLFPAAP